MNVNTSSVLHTKPRKASQANATTRALQNGLLGQNTPPAPSSHLNHMLLIMPATRCKECPGIVHLVSPQFLRRSEFRNTPSGHDRLQPTGHMHVVDMLNFTITCSNENLAQERQSVFADGRSNRFLPLPQFLRLGVLPVETNEAVVVKLI